MKLSTHLISAFKGEFYYGNVSPDGKKILVTKFFENNDIISIPLDGSQPKSIIATSQNESSLSFSKDGNKSTYITNKNGYDEIWLRKNDEDIRPIVSKKDFPEINDFTIGNAEISPDGKLIAFRVYSKEISSKVFLVPTTGGKPTRLLSGEGFEYVLSWSPDSKFLIFLINDVIAQIKVGAQE